MALLSLGIEPTDSSKFPNIALFDHRTGRRYEDLGAPPPVGIAILGFGGGVDTVAFNRQDRSLALKENEPVVAEALALVRQGIREGRPALVGAGATLSAEAHQRILYEPPLPAVLALAREVDAAGVNVAHIGTVAGILVDPARGSVEDVLALAKKRITRLAGGIACRLAGGGWLSQDERTPQT